MKNVLIVGATSAIAEHCARVWASRGDQLFLVARDNTRLSTIAGDLRVRGACAVHTHAMDARDTDRHESMIDEADARLGGIDIVLMAWGTLSVQAECEQSVDLTMKEIQNNGLSVVAMLTVLGNRFEQRKHGVIAVITSVAGDRGRASNYVYGASKSMVSAFLSGIRQRLHRAGVAVVDIKPGFIDTPMTAQFTKGMLWATPAHIAPRITGAIDRKKNDVYVPAFWWMIMTVIRCIPSWLFRKLPL